jgi:DNA polymerase
MNREPYNGLPPFVAGVDTSEAASQSIASDSGQLREFIFDLIKGSGGGGMTCDEVEVETSMRHQTASARIRELQQRGRIVDSSRRRPTRSTRLAIVWVATEPETQPTVTSQPVASTSEAVLGQPLLFSANVIDPSGDEGLAPLRKRCLDCTKCDLAKTRKNAVFGEGNSERPDICFIGEAPADSEDERGHAFIGPSGAMITRILKAMGYRRDEVYLMYAVACRPPGNRPPEKFELTACSEFLLGQVRAVRPRVVVALGANVVTSLLSSRSKKKIAEIRGKWFEWEGLPLMPTIPPAKLCAAERFPEGKEVMKLAWTDMQMVLTKLGRRKTD